MTSPDKPAQELKNPDSPVLDSAGLAALLGISVASIPSIRSRSPEKLPPPYLSRPLRWRRSTVFEWMEEQEAAARQEAETRFAAERGSGGLYAAPHRCVRCVSYTWAPLGGGRVTHSQRISPRSAPFSHRARLSPTTRLQPRRRTTRRFWQSTTAGIVI